MDTYPLLSQDLSYKGIQMAIYLQRRLLKWQCSLYNLGVPPQGNQHGDMTLAITGSRTSQNTICYVTRTISGPMSRMESTNVVVGVASIKQSKMLNPFPLEVPCGVVFVLCAMYLIVYS